MNIEFRVHGLLFLMYSLMTVFLALVVGPLAVSGSAFLMGVHGYQVFKYRPTGPNALDKARKQEMAIAQKEADEFNARTLELEREYCSVWATRLLEAKMVEAGSMTAEEMSVCDNSSCADCNETKKIVARKERAYAYLKPQDKKPEVHYSDVLFENYDSNVKAIEQYKRMQTKYLTKASDNNHEHVFVETARGYGYTRNQCYTCNMDWTEKW